MVKLLLLCWASKCCRNLCKPSLSYGQMTKVLSIHFYQYSSFLSLLLNAFSSNVSIAICAITGDGDDFFRDEPLTDQTQRFFYGYVNKQCINAKAHHNVTVIDLLLIQKFKKMFLLKLFVFLVYCYSTWRKYLARWYVGSHSFWKWAKGVGRLYVSSLLLQELKNSLLLSLPVVRFQL